MNKEQIEKCQQVADSTRSIYFAVSSEKEKELQKSVKDMADQLTKLGVPFILFSAIPYEIEKGEIGTLQYNNLTNFILQAKSEEELAQAYSLNRYCNGVFIEDICNSFSINSGTREPIVNLFAEFTKKVFSFFHYTLTDLARSDKQQVVDYFKKLIKT